MDFLGLVKKSLWVAVGFGLFSMIGMIWASSHNDPQHQALQQDFSKAFFMCLGYVLGGFVTTAAAALSDTGGAKQRKKRRLQP